MTRPAKLPDVADMKNILVQTRLAAAKNFSALSADYVAGLGNFATGWDRDSLSAAGACGSWMRISNFLEKRGAHGLQHAIVLERPGRL